MGKGLTEGPLLFEYCGVNAGSVAVGLLDTARHDLNQALCIRISEVCLLFTT